jgi:two-component system sensor histidine kinase BaeS
MSDATVGTTVSSRRVLESVVGDLWPDQRTAGRPALVGAASAVGALGAAVLPFRDPGVGTFLVLVAVCGVVVAAARERLSRTLLAPGTLCPFLLSTVVLRDAAWIVVLCVLAAYAVGSAVLTGARSVNALLAATAAVPLAGIRGIPWLRRSLAVPGRAAQWWPVVRTAALSLGLVVVFGALFASADALFARWVDVLVPDLTVGSLTLRGLVLATVFALTAAAAYVALTPPRVDRLALPAGRPVRRFEWVVPVGLVVATFVGFLAAQATALFGGHGYLRRTTGLTYADYVHQGFGQLTLATALTLVVVGAAARHAPRGTRADRALLRVLLGVLCLLTLVVVASALYRVHLYEQAYGFTRLRLLVSVFETWLGVVIVLVLVSGMALRGGWVPRAALLTGATMLLGLAAVNPDAYIAERNIARFEKTGRIDWYYLAGLSDDAAPVFASLPERYRSCLVTDTGPPQRGDDWLEWNLGRARADAALEGGLVSTVGGCAARP